MSAWNRETYYEDLLIFPDLCCKTLHTFEQNVRNAVRSEEGKR